MRMLHVDKYLGYYTVRYFRNRPPAWWLSDLSMKTHGLVSFPDKTFFKKEDAVDYASTIAQRMNAVFGTPETGIRVKDNGSITNIVITTKEDVIEAEYDNVPTTDWPNWNKLKKEN